MKLKTQRSLGEAISEVKREMQVRERCFDKWIQDGKMTDIDAQDRFDRLGTALEILQQKHELLQGIPAIEGK